MGIINKIIKLALAVLAVIVCFQVIGINSDQILSIIDEDAEQYQPEIVSTLQHDNNKAVYDGISNQTTPPKS